MDGVIEQMLASGEPSIVWRIRSGVLDESGTALSPLREQIRNSNRAKTLLALVNLDHVYDKWHGAHWVLAALADLGYPVGSPELMEARNAVYGHWLSATYFTEFEARSEKGAYGKKGVPLMQGRYRRCGSQHGNALRSTVRLDIEDDRAPMLVERLLHWQWPDGGWNCDRNPSASTSSFMETLLPMRGLQAYAVAHRDETARTAARNAAEVFLERRLVFGRRNHRPINPDFLRLHFPLYWHYDLLGGLLAMSELDLISDPRCVDALNLLEKKRLPDGGWPAEAKFYTVSMDKKANSDSVDWGGTSRVHMNPWVTAEALVVLKKAGRL